MVRVRSLAVAIMPFFTVSACGLRPADVREGCYRFDDGTPLFKVVGKRGIALSRGSQVKSFTIGGWHEPSRKSVEIKPAFYLPGLPAGDPRRGDTLPIPTISYSRFAFDPKRDAFQVPVAAWGEEQVRLGRPC